MVLQIGPHILFHLMGANSALHFLSDAFLYNTMARPNISSVSRGLHTVLSKAKLISNKESYIFPGRPRIYQKPLVEEYKQNPLLRQQVEWNVRQVLIYILLSIE